MDRSINSPPPSATERATASAPQTPAKRVCDCVGAEHGLRRLAGRPADKPPGHRGVVTECHPFRGRAPVPGDAEPHLAVPVRDHVRSQAQGRQRARPGRLDHDVRDAEQRLDGGPARRGPEVRGQAAVPGVQPVEELPVAGARAVRPVGRFHLDDVRAGQPEQPRA